MRLAVVAVALLVCAPAGAHEVTFHLAAEEDGRPAPARLVVADLPDGRVAVLRDSELRRGRERLLVGTGRRTRDGFEVELREVEEPGLAGRLGAPPRAPRPAARGVYALAGGRLSGVVHSPGGAGGWRLARDVGAAVPLLLGAGRRSAAASDRGAPIDVDRLNAGASRRLVARSTREREVAWPVVVCPGYASDDQTAPLHPTARARVVEAARVLRAERALVVLVTGGNVHPPGTPYNEALELRRALLELGVEPDRIAVDPYARHSTTNLRNAGRFLLAHGLERALVSTSRGQSFYFGHPWLSTYHLRCLLSLGYTVGSLRARGARLTAFEPSRRCLRRGDDPLDP